MYPLAGKISCGSCTLPSKKLAAGTLSLENILRQLHLAANNLSDSLNLANSGPIIVFDGHWDHFFWRWNCFLFFQMVPRYLFLQYGTTVINFYDWLFWRIFVFCRFEWSHSTCLGRMGPLLLWPLLSVVLYQWSHRAILLWMGPLWSLFAFLFFGMNLSECYKLLPCNFW